MREPWPEVPQGLSQVPEEKVSMNCTDTSSDRWIPASRFRGNKLRGNDLFVPAGQPVAGRFGVEPGTSHSRASENPLA